MARKINSVLLKKMTNGVFLTLLNYVKSDKDLRLEVRQGGKAFVYYLKGKALEIGLNKFCVDEKYVKNTAFSMPDTELAKTNPADYFRQMKKIIDNYVDNVKKRSEFDTQQKIASNNQKQDSRYIIIDMEYAFPQSGLEKEKRVKKAGFDLLGLDRETGNVVFFEVKKGGKALKGTAGIKTHIEDFEECLFGKNKHFFREILKKDIENIISDKTELGIIEYSLPDNFKIDDSNIDFIFVYESDEETFISDYRKIFNQESDKTKTSRVYNSLFVSPANKYNLSYRESERIKMMEWSNKSLGKYRSFILNDGKQNLYSGITDEAIKYFEKNNISWWTCKSICDIDETKPTRHILSSQISCINHLFPFRCDKEAVLSIAKTICSEVENVLEIVTDSSDNPSFIAFEQVSDIDHLFESVDDDKKLTRGTKCTSVDALIYAELKNETKILLPIEWKYTEKYGDEDFSVGEDKKRYNSSLKSQLKSGQTRLDRYSALITKFNQLKTFKDYKNSIYFFEPFYQLMRQTLWAEQMIAHKETETIKADDFIHAHIIPQGNYDLLKKRYLRSEKDMESTWRNCLSNQEKYKILSPKDLLASIDQTKYQKLISYLLERYW